MTPFIKKKEIKNNWYLVNGENLIVGRLAAYLSKVLRGKNKTQFNPNQDNGDFVIVTNIEKIKFSGKKFKNKKYYRHTGYPGGIKETSPIKLKEKNKSQECCQVDRWQKNNLLNSKCIMVKNILIVHKIQ